MTREILNLLQAIALTFEVTSSSGNPGTRRWYHAPAQSSSIKLWLRPRGRWYGFDHFSKISAFHLIFQCPCIVIIKPLSSSLEIPPFMSVQSTLRLTATTYETRLCPEYLHSSCGIISSACGCLHKVSSWDLI